MMSERSRREKEKTQGEEAEVGALRVAGAQMAVAKDVAANQRTILRAVDFAASEGADILLTPEGSVSGYTHEFDQVAVEHALQEITEKARNVGMGLALGSCFVEPEGNTCYNQIRFYGKDGMFLGFHAKILRCGTHHNPPKGEIEHYGAERLRTFAFDGIAVGGLICNDLWANPECTPMPDTHLTQQLAGMGARVIFHAVNGGRSAGEWSEVAWRFHEANLRMRAKSGKVWIVTVDNCAPTDLPCSAPSGVIDPEGNWVTQTEPKGEAFFVHSIELNHRQGEDDAR